MTWHAKCLPVRTTPEELHVATVRLDVVDHLRRLTAHDADGMCREIRGAFLLPLARIATLASGRAGLVEAGFALGVHLLLAFALETGGNGSAAPT
jgi:hypothetical protein